MSTTGNLRGCRDIKINREHAKNNQCKLKNHSINNFLIFSSFNYFGTKVFSRIRNYFPRHTSYEWIRPSEKHENDEKRTPENYRWNGFVQKGLGRLKSDLLWVICSDSELAAEAANWLLRSKWSRSAGDGDLLESFCCCSCFHCS